MAFSVEVLPELTNIISIETTFTNTVETDIDAIESNKQTLEIINNNYNNDIEYTKNIIDIETTNVDTTTNYIDIEIYDTYALEIVTDTTLMSNIHYSRVDGLADFIDSRIPNAFDCGTP